MPALAVPGDQARDSAWALGFEDRDVTIVMDADRAGRLAAQRIQGDLADVTRTVTIADLVRDRQDGYDLTE
jgi:DNA primase